MVSFVRNSVTFVTVIVAASLLLGSASVASEQLNEQLQLRRHNDTQGQSRDVADQLLRLGQQEVEAANYQAAIAAWYRAVEIYTILGDFTSAGIAYDYIGRAYTDRGLYTEAEDVIRRRIAIAQDYGDFQGQVYGYNNLGTVFIQSGLLAQAEAAFQVAIPIAEDIEDWAGLGISFSNLGLVERLRGDLIAAEAYYESAIGYRFQADDLVGQAHSSNSLGQIYRRLNQDSAALGAFLVAYRAASDADHIPTLLPALDGLIDLYRDRGDLSQAWRYLQERIVITEQPSATPAQKLGTFIQLGQYYEQLAELEDAQIAYEQALGLAQQVKDPARRAFVLNRLQGLRLQSSN